MVFLKMTIHNKKVILIPPCMLASGIQVITTTDSHAWRFHYWQLFMKYEMDIIPYICAEASFRGYENGMLREPHGIDYYQKLDGYQEHCRKLAEHTAQKIISMKKGGYEFVAILGIENSPSCAINYIYTHKGMKKRLGIYMTLLKDYLTHYEVDIPFIGINRKHPRKSLEMLEMMLKFEKESIKNDNHL